MRSDYTLYVIAIICFILAAIVFAGYPPIDSGISMVTTAVMAILGIISVGAGYLVRPEEMTPPPQSASKPSAPPLIRPQKTTTSPIEIVEVKGIGSKRAEQLRALGINTAQELAETKATTLATKIELSPKITRKWVREAKRLTEEAS